MFITNTRLRTCWAVWKPVGLLLWLESNVADCSITTSWRGLRTERLTASPTYDIC